MKLKLSVYCVVGALLVGQVHGARAQLLDQLFGPGTRGLQIEPGVTVTSRERPDFDFRGIRTGAFVTRPQVSEAFGYDDNATGTKPAKGSTFVETQLNLRTASDLPRYGVAGAITVDDYRYLSQPKQSYTNWVAALGGTYNVGRDTATLDYSHSNLNQTPRDLDTPLLDQSISYRIDNLTGSYEIPINRLSLRPTLALTRYDFSNGTVAGQPYIQTFRNRNVITPAIVASYELAPRRSIVVLARNSTADYTNPTAGTPKRNYNDAELLAGLDYDGGGLWRYRALVGYEVRTFTNNAYKTIQAPVVEATAIFTPSGLTTLTGTVSRRIQDSSSESTVGYTETAARLTIDHELRRNVLLHGQGGVYLDSFNQNQGNQVLYSAGVGATWLVNRNIRLAATYAFTTRQSNSSATTATTGSNPGLPLGSSFLENIYLIQLTFGL